MPFVPCLSEDPLRRFNFPRQNACFALKYQQGCLYRDNRIVADLLPRRRRSNSRHWPVNAKYDLDVELRRFRARVSYDGTCYHGWQFQPRQKTIQGVLEAQFKQKLSGTTVRVVGASRTDTGVHARGQMVHFDLPVWACPDDAIAAEKFEFTLNRMLPSDIRVFDFEPAPEVRKDCGSGEPPENCPFNAIFDAQSKLYSYRITIARAPDPLERLYRYHEWRCLREATFDAAAAAEAARIFEGSHDFSAFTNAGPKVKEGANLPAVLKNPIRTVRSVSVIDEGHGRYRFDFLLEGALYRMVRNMVGGILEVGCGKLESDQLSEILESRERSLAPRGAPAHGLCLETVMYDV